VEVNSLLNLARRLPINDDAENLKRIRHAIFFGHVLILKSGGRIVGYAEVYRMQEPPSYPVIPWPVDDPKGKILYCWAAVCEEGYLFELIRLGKRTFPDCHCISWHRHRRNNKIHFERI